MGFDWYSSLIPVLFLSRDEESAGILIASRCPGFRYAFIHDKSRAATSQSEENGALLG